MSSDPLPLPDQHELPLFVYGALKPGLPANERIDQFVERYEKDTIGGELQVRDGLPLALLNNSGLISGYVVHWQPGQEREGYDAVCSFGPRDHYVWGNVELNSGNGKANVLEIRHPNKGNPQHIFKPDWAITDDPAFGEGLATVEDAIKEIEKTSGKTSGVSGSCSSAHRWHICCFGRFLRGCPLGLDHNSDHFLRRSSAYPAKCLF